MLLLYPMPKTVTYTDTSLEYIESGKMLPSQANIIFEYNPEITKFIVDKGYNEKFGARPLRRAIQRYIEDEISEMILKQELSDGQKIIITLVDNKLDFKAK